MQVFNVSRHRTGVQLGEIPHVPSEGPSHTKRGMNEACHQRLSLWRLSMPPFSGALGNVEGAHRLSPNMRSETFERQDYEGLKIFEGIQSLQ